MKRRNPFTILIAFALGLGAALLLQLLGFNVVAPDKTSTLAGILTGVVLGGGILWVVRKRR